MIRAANLAVRFLLELASLAAVAYWGATLDASAALRTAAAILLPLAVATVWGIFISPKARNPTGRMGRSGLGLLVFLTAAGALFNRDHTTLAVWFAVVATLSSTLLLVYPQ